VGLWAGCQRPAETTGGSAAADAAAATGGTGGTGGSSELFELLGAFEAIP